MIFNDKEKKRLVANLTWMITDMKYKSDEEKRNFEEGSAGGYSTKLQEAMSLLEDIEKTETTETTGCHRKSVSINCREFIKDTRKGCVFNRQGTCALVKITLERIGGFHIGWLKCVQAERLKPEDENQKYTKPCPYDNSVPCVQYPEDDAACGCDPCEQCEVKLEAEH